MELASITAYIGHDYGCGEWTPEQIAQTVAIEAAACDIQGFTLSEALGYWLNPTTGKAEIERSSRLDLLNLDLRIAETLLDRLTRDLLQWSIVYEVRTSTGSRTRETTNDPTAGRMEASRRSM